MNKIYNLGIIGFGGMAHEHYRQLVKYGEELRINVKGIFDLSKEQLKDACAKGLVAYSSREEMLSDPEIDIVLVATTNEVHAEIAIDAMRHGKHVICEKPVTMTSEELIKVIKVANQTGKVFTIDQNRRTNGDFVTVKENIEKGMIGKVYHVESRVEGSRGMPSGWRTIKHLGGGMMLDWGVHLIDQLMYMNTSAVTNVFCKMYSIDYPEVDDNFHLSLTFENGMTAFIEVATNNYITKPRWYALGTEGTLQVTDWDCNGEIVRVKDKQNTWEEKIFMTKAGPTKTMAARHPDTIERIPLSYPKNHIDNLTVVYHQFVDAIEGKAELTIKPDQALRVMRVMEAAFESNEKATAIITNI